MKRKDEDFVLEVWVFEDVATYGYIVVQASFEESLKEAEKFCINHNIDMESKEKIFSFETYRKGKMIDEKKILGEGRPRGMRTPRTPRTASETETVVAGRMNTHNKGQKTVMKNENNGKSVEKMAEELIDKEKMTEELIDKVIAQMEKSGATIDGLKRVIAAIERRKAQLNEANHEEDRKRDVDDEKIKIVRRTLSSDVKNGIVIAMNKEGENSSYSEHVVIAKGETDEIVAMMTEALVFLLKKVDVSLEKYIGYLQLVVAFAKKKGGVK